MKSLPLPVECLQIIIKNIADEFDSTTLSILLRVNRAFFQATLPFLYSSPHQFLLRCEDVDDLYRRSGQLSALLLQCSPVELQPELLLARYDINTPTGASLSRLGPISNYLSHMRYFQTLDSAQQKLSLVIPSVRHYLTNIRLVQFVHARKLDQAYLAKEHQLEINPYQDPNTRILFHVNFEVQRGATWALCSSILEQIRALTIPVSDIARYHQSIHRLQSLREVTFLLDEKIMPARHVMLWLQEEDMKAHNKILQNQEEMLEAMYQFVQTHVDVHKNILHKVECPPNKTWIGCPQACPEKTLSKLLNLLPSSR
ncbi:hypothetical protein BG005_007459 [Podila minutissima]|nr:hypothetical protein BG005_007459 [Podila minutissima]